MDIYISKQQVFLLSINMFLIFDLEMLLSLQVYHVPESFLKELEVKIVKLSM